MVSAHVLVKNEENFIWYSVMSVIEYIDEILIWDTGSTDSTREIIKEIIKLYPHKINYKEVGNVNKNKYSQVRQQMIDESKYEWIFILDGDEIWWHDSIKKIVDLIKKEGQNWESIIIPTYNLIGDLFHYQEKEAGRYRFGNKIGHYALRFMNRNNIPGLHVFESYGKEGFADNNSNPIQNRNENKILFIDAPYIHTTHLIRSSKDSEVMQRSKKRKYEIGLSFPKDFYYPESFFTKRPDIVSNVWKNIESDFKLRATIETPLRKLKRKII